MRYESGQFIICQLCEENIEDDTHMILKCTPYNDLGIKLVNIANDMNHFCNEFDDIENEFDDIEIFV